MTARLPRPKYFGRERRWKLSDILAWEAALTGEVSPPPLPPEKEKWFTAAQLRDRLSVSDMWLWRRRRERELAEQRAPPTE